MDASVLKIRVDRVVKNRVESKWVSRHLKNNSTMILIVTLPYTYSEKLPSINFSQKDREILGFPISETPLKSDENSVSKILFLSN